MSRRASVLAALLLVLSSCSVNTGAYSDLPFETPATATHEPLPTAEAVLSELPEAIASVKTVSARVTRVVDGDTAVMKIGDIEEKVRFIGVDTPESTTKTEPFGREASNFTKERLTDKQVWLETDVDKRDRYKRLLAYVWLAKPLSGVEKEARATMFNAHLAAEGYALQLTIPPNVKYASLFSRLVSEARDANLGLWGLTPVKSSASTATPRVTSGNSDCDPSYPDVCIPSPPPDLDCPEISHRRFRVVGSDPHRFDQDKDGIGCESG